METGFGEMPVQAEGIAQTSLLRELEADAIRQAQMACFPAQACASPDGGAPW